MNVFALASYPLESAATRFRVDQFIEPLRERGIKLELSPFLSGEQFGRMYSRGDTFGKVAGLISPFFRRVGEVITANEHDLLLVQREAMFFGPAIFEYLMQKVGRLPMVLDLDDATYVPYTSPSFGRLGSSIKFFGKTDRLISRATRVVCGNRFIAEYVESKGTPTTVIPTIVDTDIFKPGERQNEVPVIGWIGTHSTFPSVRSIFPVLQRLAKKHRFVLRLVGTGVERLELPGVELENLPWSMEREVQDFQGIDIGLYSIMVSPSANQLWLHGKSGFKAVQYMAVGVPFVMSPVGICAEMGLPGSTHFNATSNEHWYDSLNTLLASEGERRRIGLAGRQFALRHYNLPRHADLLADALKSAITRRGN